MSVVIYCSLYVSALVAANLSVAAFGPWVSPINALILIGLDLTLRDKLHDAWSGNGLWPKMTALILLSSIASWALNPAAGQIAAASFVAFAVSGAIDAVAYHALRSRPYLYRVNGSNAVGAGADSLLFPLIAFGAFLPHIVALQFVAKFAGGAVWSIVLRKMHVRQAAA